MDLNQQYNNLLKDLSNPTFSQEEKYKMIELFKSNVLNSKNTGKKVIRTVDGKKIKIPKKYLGKYQSVCRLIKTNSFSKAQTNLLPELEPIINRSSYLKEDYYQLQLKISDQGITDNEKRQLIRQFVSDNAIAINFLKGKKEYQPSVKKDLTISDLVSAEKNKVIPIQKIKKPKNKGRLKRNIKILIASVSALLVMASCTTIYSQFKSTSSSDVVTTSIATEYQTPEPTKSPVITTPQVYEKHKEIKKSTKNKLKVPKLNHLNKSFNLVKKATIYTNMSDANNNINGQTPYFNYDTNRTVIGYGLEYQNKNISIIKIEDNNYKIRTDSKIVYLTEKEANKYISKLMKKKAKMKSVLAHNTNSSSKNSIEGFYNIKDIKLKRI